MSLDHWVSLAGAVIAFLGLLAVAVQIRDSTRQREAQALIEVYDINRQLLGYAFDHPLLLPVLDDADGVDPVWEKRYLQGWLNQLALIYNFLEQSTFNQEQKVSFMLELEDWMAQRNMRHHWAKYGQVYTPSFQALVNGVVRKNEPPVTAAHVHSIG